MSSRKQKKGPRRPRKQARRRQYSPVITSVRRTTTGLPDQFRVQLRYSDIIDMSSANDVKNQIFRGNSLYDPDYTNIGHQPRYFDNYIAMYQKYRVLSSRIHISYINNAPSCSMVGVIVPNTDPLVFTSLAQATELPRAKYTPFIPVSARYGYNLAARTTTRTVCGISRSEQWDEDYSGTASSNPTNMWYWNVLCCMANASYTVVAQIKVDIVYDAIFYDKVEAPINYTLSDVSDSRNHKSPVEKQGAEPVCNIVKVFSPVR